MQNIIEGEISGKCDSQSGNGDMVLRGCKRMFPFNIKCLKKNGRHLTANFKIPQVLMRQAVTHLLMRLFCK